MLSTKCYSSQRYRQISKASSTQARSFCYGSRYRHSRMQAHGPRVSLEGITGHQRNTLFLYSSGGICSFQMIYTQWHTKALASKPRTCAAVSGMYPCSYYWLRQFLSKKKKALLGNLIASTWTDSFSTDLSVNTYGHPRCYKCSWLSGKVSFTLWLHQGSVIHILKMWKTQ